MAVMNTPGPAATEAISAAFEGASIGFRPVLHGDLPVLRDWIASPHWQAWWEEPDKEISYIRDMIEGRDTTRPYIISVAGEDLGYIQNWFVADFQNSDWSALYPWIDRLPAETVGVDLSIGPPELLGRGLGTAALRQFVDRLRAERHDFIIIDPAPSNYRAVRAYEKAGFVLMTELEGQSGDCLIMRHMASHTPDTTAREPR